MSPTGRSRCRPRTSARPAPRSAARARARPVQEGAAHASGRAPREARTAARRTREAWMLSGLDATSRRSASCGHLREHLGEAVDLLRSPLLGDADEQGVVHAGVVAAERVAGMDAPLAR